MKATITIFLSLIVVSCGSSPMVQDRTVTTIPIAPNDLIGRWEGTYALTYHIGTDSTYTYEVGMWIEFSDTSFSFQGDDHSHPCGTYGAGTYTIEGEVIEFRDNLPRIMICSWENVLNDEFNYHYEPTATELRLTQRWESYLWQVEITKVRRWGLD